MDRADNIIRLSMRLRQYARYALGRVLGTVPASSGRYLWHIDSAERSLFVRVELSALVELLSRKGLVTREEWLGAMEEEFALYADDLAKQWPEVRVAEDGRSFALDPTGFADRVRSEGWPK